MESTVTASFKTTRENKARISRLAKSTKRPAGFFYNYLLGEYLDDLEDIFLSEQRLADLSSNLTETVSDEELYKKLGIQ